MCLTIFFAYPILIITVFYAKYEHKIRPLKQQKAEISFSLRKFFSFLQHKLFLNTLKKIFNCLKKKNCFKKKKNIDLKHIRGMIYRKYLLYFAINLQMRA